MTEFVFFYFFIIAILEAATPYSPFGRVDIILPLAFVIVCITIKGLILFKF
jgi:hypothetical protein